MSKTELLLIIYLGTQIINTLAANLCNGKINAQFDEQYKGEPTGFLGTQRRPLTQLGSGAGSGQGRLPVENAV